MLALGVFGELQRLRSVLHSADRLARLVLEVVQHALQLLLQLADFFALLLLAFLRKVITFARYLLFTGTEANSVGVYLAQLRVQAIEETRDVLGLRTSASLARLPQSVHSSRAAAQC